MESISARRLRNDPGFGEDGSGLSGKSFMADVYVTPVSMK